MLTRMMAVPRNEVDEKVYRKNIIVRQHLSSIDEVNE